MALLLLLSASGRCGWGRRWLAVLFVLYVALSMPLVSGWLHRTLAGVGPITDASEARDAATIVLLGNGVVTVGPAATAIHLPGVNTALNVSEAARLYRLLGRRRIVASGGMPPGGAGKRPESEVMRDYLVRLGVAGEDIELESASTNTTEQAERVTALLPQGRPRVAGHDARTHAAGSGAVPQPRARRRAGRVGFDSWHAERRGPRSSCRTATRCAPARSAVYEFMAYAFYRLRGDIAR